MFINTRAHDVVDGLRIAVRYGGAERSSCRTRSRSGGAQQAGRVHGKNLTFASDVDYIRGRHSWRGGISGLCRLVPRKSQQQLPGNLHLRRQRRVPRRARPLLYTQSIGDPSLSFFHARIGAYFQDDYPSQEGSDAQPGCPLQLPDPRRRSRGVRAPSRHHVGAHEERQHDATSKRRHLSRLAGPRDLVADGALRRRPSARGRHQQPAVSRSRRERSHSSCEYLPAGRIPV